jgi:hypothetical protein
MKLSEYVFGKPYLNVFEILDLFSFFKIQIAYKCSSFDDEISSYTSQFSFPTALRGSGAGGES